MTVEVDRETRRELALRRLNAVACAVFQDRDRVAVDRCRKRCFERRIVNVADLCNRLGPMRSQSNVCSDRRREVKRLFCIL